MDTQNQTLRSVRFESMPQALKDPPQWVLWREVNRDGRLTKVPCESGGSLASSTDPSTWSDFETVRSEFDAYALVCERAKPFPAVARKAARDGTVADYQGAGPFDCSVGKTRRSGEVAQ